MLFVRKSARTKSVPDSVRKCIRAVRCHAHCFASLSLIWFSMATTAQAYTVGISPASRSLYLQVGAGNMTTGNVNSAGNNALRNNVSVTVPAAQLGNGTSMPMSTDSTVVASPIDGASYCTTTGQVYIGSFFRTTGTTSSGASLSVTTPAFLSSAGATVPFSTIAWTSGTAAGGSEIASGSFTSTSMTLTTVAANTWSESCLLFRYTNQAVVPSGAFKGTATYTLTAP